MLVRRVVSPCSKMTVERLCEIIVKSGSVPIGRITDQFDKEVKGIFGDSFRAKEISLFVLRPSSEKLKLPPKMKNLVFDAVLQNIESLSFTEILAIPHFLKRIRASTGDSENRIFDRFCEKLFQNISSVSRDELVNVFSTVSQLEDLKHACKNAPIIRLFESMIPPAQEASLRILSSAASSLKREVLAHPLVRSRCIDLVRALNEQDLGEVLHVVSRLPVFPESNLDAIIANNKAGSSSKGVATLLSIKSCSMEQTKACLKKLESNFDQNDFLQHVPGIKKIWNLNAAIFLLETVIVPELVDKKHPRQIAGLLRLIMSCNDPNNQHAHHNPELISSFLQSSPDILSVATVLRYIPLGDAQSLERLSGMINPSDLTPGLMRILCQRPFPGLEALVCAATNIEALAVALVKLNSQIVADRLKDLCKSVSDVKLLIRVSTILSESGTIHSDPALLGTPRGSTLKEIHRKVFHVVRMAPF